MAVEEVRAELPRQAESENPDAREPHAGVVVQVSGVDELVHPGIHGIDAGGNQPLVATSGLDADVAGGEADFAEALKRFEELGLLGPAVDPPGFRDIRYVGHGHRNSQRW